MLFLGIRRCFHVTGQRSVPAGGAGAGRFGIDNIRNVVFPGFFALLGEMGLCLYGEIRCFFG